MAEHPGQGGMGFRHTHFMARRLAQAVLNAALNGEDKPNG